MAKNTKRIAYLHIGSHKTGTSAIQKSLFLNNKKLIDNNFLFPVSILGKNLCHNNMSLSILHDKNKDLDHYLHYLEKEISKNEHNIIISSELLEKLIFSKKDKIIKIINLLTKHFREINIIYCVRNETDLCDSVFKQMVGSKEYRYKDSTENFIKDFYDKKFSYNNIIDNWMSLENIKKCYVYWYSKNFNDNINNFKKACKIDIDLQDPGLVNMSLDGKILQIAYFYNNKNNNNHSTIKILKSLQYSINKSWTKKSTILTNDQVEFYKNFFTNQQWNNNCIFLNEKPNQEYSKELFVPANEQMITNYIKDLYKETNLLDLFKILT